MYLGYKLGSMKLGLPVILLFDLRNNSHMRQFRCLEDALKAAASKSFSSVAVVLFMRG